MGPENSHRDIETYAEIWPCTLQKENQILKREERFEVRFAINGGEGGIRTHGTG